MTERAIPRLRADINAPWFSTTPSGETLHSHSGDGWAISATAGEDGLCAWCRVPLKPEEIEAWKSIHLP